MVQIVNGIRNLEAQLFTIWTKSSHFVKKPFEICTKIPRFGMVRFSNDWNHSLIIALARPFQNCRYSVAQMCTREDTLVHYLGTPYLDDAMSQNELTTLV